jgi:uncharacterized protein DUF3800
MQVYLDESGDTGWKFSSPYRRGGSSRFLCLAFLFLPKSANKIPKRIMIDMYDKYGWLSEKKASDSTENQKLEFAKAVNTMLETRTDIKIDCIIVKKEKVQPHITKDPNKLYNFMCKLVVVDYVKSLSEFEFIPDKRTIKVESGNSLSDYLQTELWFECGSKAKLLNRPQESHRNYNLQFIDWIANCVWSHFEDSENNVFHQISKNIRIRQLFF